MNYIRLANHLYSQASNDHEYGLIQTQPKKKRNHSVFNKSFRQIFSDQSRLTFLIVQFGGKWRKKVN